MEGATARAAISGVFLLASAWLLALNLPRHYTGPRWPGEGYTVKEAPYYGNAHVFGTVGFNEKGQVAGYCSDRAGFTAHLFDGTSNHDLGVLAGYVGSSSYGVNGTGDCVGICYRNGPYATRPTVGCLWDSRGAHPLPPLPGLPDSRAWSVNDNGEVVGLSYDPGNVDDVEPRRSIPTVWVHEAPSPLQLPEGSVRGEARSLNSKGQVVGTVTLKSGRTRACVWEAPGHRPHLLPPLDMAADERGVAINNNGAAIGRSGVKGVLWEKDLPRSLDLPGAPNVVPLAINDQGAVVVNDQVNPTANLDVEDDPMIPFLFRPARPAVRISHLIPSGSGYQFVKGMGINNKGQILAGVFHAGTESKILILSPPR